MTRELLVFGAKTFKITIPDDAKITFGPWSPQMEGAKNAYAQSDRALVGTLRVYKGAAKTTENILAVFSGVTGFRDMNIDYMEQVAKEEGAIIWKSDKSGYSREEKVNRASEWVDPTPLLGSPEDDAD